MRGKRHLRARLQRPDQLAVLADVFVDGAAVRPAVAAGEACESAHHRLVRGGEHVMEAKPQPALDTPVADHGPRVVGQLHFDGLAQERREARCEDEARAVRNEMDPRRARPCFEGDGNAGFGAGSGLAEEEGELPHGCEAL